MLDQRSVFDSQIVDDGPFEEQKKKAKRAPRIGFTITESQSSALERFVPWGNLTALYQAITEDLLELFEKHGSAKILAAVISRQIRFYDISKTLKDVNNEDSGDK